MEKVLKYNFAVFICTHGRPDKQYTFQTLRASGYKGPIFLVVDNEDDTVDRLRILAGVEDNVGILSFNKQDYIDSMDTGTIEDQRKCILYAKGFCEDAAKYSNYDAFIIADDDILKFRYRYIEDGKLKSLEITDNMDKVINYYLDFMLDNDMTAVGFGMAQHFFSGIDTFMPYNFLKYRIPYNFVFRNTKHEVNWMSWYGEDIITAVYNGRVGQKWLTLPLVQQDIYALGKADGGMKETYSNNSSIRLAMQNVMYLPTELSAYNYRGKFMASINKDNAFPRIISSCYAK